MEGRMFFPFDRICTEAEAEANIISVNKREFAEIMDVSCPSGADKGPAQPWLPSLRHISAELYDRALG